MHDEMMKIIMLENMYGPMIKRIEEILEWNLNLEMKKYKITNSQGKVICFLSSQSGYMCSQKTLEDFLEVSHPTTVSIVKSMEKKKLIRIETDTKDKRMKNIYLIWGSPERYEELNHNALRTESILTKGFSEKEKAQFISYLNRAYENMLETQN